MAPSLLVDLPSAFLRSIRYGVPLLFAAAVPLAVPAAAGGPFEPLVARCGSSNSDSDSDTSSGSDTNSETPEPQFELWQHPVDAPVIDGFRPPANPYGPGNRGLEYGTESGDPVSAAAPGVVAFAGQVGGRLFISIVHPSGLRATYSYLERIDVAVGDAVALGDPIAIADAGMHLTVRDDGIYIDPLPLMADYRCFTVRLVPLPDPSSPLTTIS